MQWKGLRRPREASDKERKVLTEMAGRMVRKLSILALYACLALSASALTVGVAPAEDKAFAPAPAGQGSPIGELVSGCLGALFDAGFIATDADVTRTGHAEWGPAEYGLAGARQGLVEYEIALFVDWAPSLSDSKVLLPVSVEYRLVRILDGEVLVSGSVAGPADSKDAADHEGRTAARAGASAAAPCVKVLAALAKGGE